MVWSKFACSKGVVQLGRLLPSSVSTPCRSHQQVEKGRRHCICIAIIAIHNLGISSNKNGQIFPRRCFKFWMVMSDGRLGLLGILLGPCVITALFRSFASASVWLRTSVHISMLRPLWAHVNPASDLFFIRAKTWANRARQSEIV